MVCMPNFKKLHNCFISHCVQCPLLPLPLEGTHAGWVLVNSIFNGIRANLLLARAAVFQPVFHPLSILRSPSDSFLYRSYSDI